MSELPHAELAVVDERKLVGRLVTPLGRAPNIRSVWFVANDDVVPRLVTAYPEPEDKA